MTKERIVYISLVLAALPLFLPGHYADEGISRYEYAFLFHIR
ncbi:hypothetical protein [Filobacillus milosensis]|nr:hypothetical protein [Filobacillus milosensis]